jgi:hypothetical protein
MSLLRAILITAWCLIVAVFHAVALWMVASPAIMDPSRLSDFHPLISISFAASLVSMVGALVAIVAVKALWIVMAAALLLLAAGLLSIFMLGFEIAPHLLVVAVVQFVLSWVIMAVNRIDNPPRPAPNPSEVF